MGNQDIVPCIRIIDKNKIKITKDFIYNSKTNFPYEENIEEFERNREINNQNFSKETKKSKNEDFENASFTSSITDTSYLTNKISKVDNRINILEIKTVSKITYLESSTKDKFNFLESTTKDKFNFLESTTKDKLNSIELTTKDKLTSMESLTIEKIKDIMISVNELKEKVNGCDKKILELGNENTFLKNENKRIIRENNELKSQVNRYVELSYNSTVKNKSIDDKWI